MLCLILCFTNYLKRDTPIVPVRKDLYVVCWDAKIVSNVQPPDVAAPNWQKYDWVMASLR